jgi:hypothetical protein
MDRTSRLVEIYEESGLKGHLESNGLVYEPKRDFSKLKFIPNDFGIRSIELWDLKGGGNYFRIHHRDTAPSWLRETMRNWEGLRTSAKFGSNFDGDPLAHAVCLTSLLGSTR